MFSIHSKNFVSLYCTSERYQQTFVSLYCTSERYQNSLLETESKYELLLTSNYMDSMEICWILIELNSLLTHSYYQGTHTHTHTQTFPILGIFLTTVQGRAHQSVIDGAQS